MDFAEMGTEVRWAEVAFSIDAVAARLWAGVFGFFVHSAHVFDPVLGSRESTLLPAVYASRSRFGTLFLWAPFAVALVSNLFVFADVMIVPNVLSEMISALEPVLSLIFLAIIAWETLSVLSMGPLMPLVCVHSGELLLAAVMLAGERSMACARSVQSYFVHRLAHIHALTARRCILMHSLHVSHVFPQ